ncbi:imidazole glycerol phosphate synthase subunit HisH [Vitreoscilla stercoraria]|uniref:Imidazole glycerol phosphate synthase subunit HisH n=1 Tax=Vitreoscilla stercoraria TaxID=61 RepID=A0ABY4EBV1_VITST|nr:imidazole glycerol phosphate synthase subunit HisH [Vitreoscilla stercoraria]UOO93217.1 imidazole glycerol phosphate synthase subunit HisH [Vitreoscilla stercoraria]
MKIAIVDYGMGNLHSVLKSAQAAQVRANVNTDIQLTSNPDVVYQADKVIFPGQGAMPDCMAALQKSGLGEAIADGFKNKPFFGICVGAQLLFDVSEEGNTQGLGWFQGSVKRFAHGLQDAQGNKLKVPHMGWNQVHQTQNHPLFQNVAQDARFYFVHSYHFAPTDASIVLGQSDYPETFACAVGRDNVFATQFHAEKSHDAGLQLFQNFLLWNGQA